MKPAILPIVGTALAIAGSAAPAAQIVEARDGARIEAVIATGEPTRIRIEHAAITDVFGNIYSSNCAPPAGMSGPSLSALPVPPAPINPAGEIMLECDRDKGEIYVRPVGTSPKPINLFIASPAATYTLLLRRSDTPSDTIVIRDRSASASVNAANNAGPLGLSANPVRAMKALLLAMASGTTAAGVQVDNMQRAVALWQEAEFVLLQTVGLRGLVGEKYRLTNRSAQAMVLAEQEFDRADGAILGVAIDALNLRPGESTTVYVIRRAP